MMLLKLALAGVAAAQDPYDAYSSSDAPPPPPPPPSDEYMPDPYGPDVYGDDYYMPPPVCVLVAPEAVCTQAWALLFPCSFPCSCLCGMLNMCSRSVQVVRTVSSLM